MALTFQEQGNLFYHRTCKIHLGIQVRIGWWCLGCRHLLQKWQSSRMEFTFVCTGMAEVLRPSSKQSWTTTYTSMYGRHWPGWLFTNIVDVS